MLIDELLEPKRLPQDRRRAWAVALRAGPWCWPWDEVRLRGARELAGMDMPSPAVGSVPIVSTGPAGASLWAISPWDPCQDPHEVEFGTEARHAWEEAALALPRALPVLWGSVRDVSRVRLAGRHLLACPAPGQSAAPERLLDGPSFGLSSLVSLASRLLEQPVASDMIASGVVDRAGCVTPVEGLARKLEAVREAPRIERVLVSADQATEAEALCFQIGVHHVRIVPVRNAADALRAAFVVSTAEGILRGFEEEAERVALVDSLFRLALTGRGNSVDWRPVERAAALALDRWHLAPGERWRLDLVRAIARRHEGGDGGLPAFEQVHVAALPAPVRLSVVAHYVQHAADTSRPSVEQALILADRFLVIPHEAHREHLALLGAKARLLAVTGEPAESMRLQEVCAKAFRDRMLDGQVSYPLSEWLRLAGALADRASFQRAAAFEECLKWLSPNGDGEPYCDLARARALVMLGTPAAAVPALQELSERAAIPHLRGSALRWLAQALRQTDEHQAAAAVTVRLEAAARESGGAPAAVARFAALARLDLAVEAGDAAGAIDALEQIRQFQPGLIAMLLEHAPTHVERAAYVARFFPY